MSYEVWIEAPPGRELATDEDMLAYIARMQGWDPVHHQVRWSEDSTGGDFLYSISRSGFLAYRPSEATCEAMAALAADLGWEICDWYEETDGKWPVPDPRPEDGLTRFDIVLADHLWVDAIGDPGWEDAILLTCRVYAPGEIDPWDADRLAAAGEVFGRPLPSALAAWLALVGECGLELGVFPGRLSVGVDRPCPTSERFHLSAAPVGASRETELGRFLANQVVVGLAE